MSIKLLITGGTFDKEYNELNGLLYFKNTHVPEMLTMARSQLDVEVKTLMMVDSLEITEVQRALIVSECAKAEQDKIVITHGTDTMTITAKRIAEVVKDKTIVLTGAMMPFKFGSSDGLFNMGSALAFVQILEPGVYIAMNGKYFHWENVEKNRMYGRFEGKSSDSSN